MQDVVLVTGSCGLVGSECVRHFAARGMKVMGIDNDQRGQCFGNDGSTQHVALELVKELGGRYTHVWADLTAGSLDFAFEAHDVALVIHCAAAPSHDWSGRYPMRDFEINCHATVRLLEATRQFAPEAKFIFVSSSKVYGDTINRNVIGPDHIKFGAAAWLHNGVPENLTIDQSMHSPYGASKAAADLMVQEYGRYYGMQTVCFRPNCITGPNHAGVELHGFLNYLVKCCATGTPYRVFGYDGKQVRDNIHAKDLVRAFAMWYDSPSVPGDVYNIGGGLFACCSILEAIEIAERVTGSKMSYTIEPEPRKGDHIWWVTDNSKFQWLYPAWKPTYTIEQLIREIYEQNKERWSTHAVHS